MLNEHDQDVLPRCPRLGQEITFGYCGVAPPPSKVLSLMDLIQQAKDRIAVEKSDAEQGRKPEP